MKAFTYFFLITIFLFTACGDDTEGSGSDCSTTTSTELSGTVLGRTFDLQTARALYDADEDEFQIQMFADDDIIINDVCGSLGTMLIGSQITFFINNAMEEVEFGGTRIVTLFHAASMEFEPTTSGCYSVEEISNTTVEGRLTLLNPDGSIMVTGSWTAIIC